MVSMFQCFNVSRLNSYTLSFSFVQMPEIGYTYVQHCVRNGFAGFPDWEDVSEYDRFETSIDYICWRRIRLIYLCFNNNNNNNNNENIMS